MYEDLQGKVAVVTGAASGIGLATAFELARNGVKVVLGDCNEAGGESAANSIRSAGGAARFVAVDVADDASVAALVATSTAEFGGVDLAFNNAGIEGTYSRAHEGTVEDWARTIAVNLTGVWSCMRHEIPAMLARGGGSIVNCSSVGGLVGFPNSSAYSASKHGVIGLTKSAALDYATSGIRINAVCPGVINTEMVRRYTHGQAELEADLITAEPIGRLGRPEEISDAVVWMLSARSGFVTGQAIPVDGGYSSR